jgi:hypothetical protein
MALQKSEQEFEKYKQTQKQLEKAQSLKEIEEDIKKLSKEGLSKTQSKKS